MKYINVMYDYEYDDDGEVLINAGEVDILLVPDFVCENLKNIVQEFFNWTDEEVRESEKSKYLKYWIQDPDGRMCMNVGSNHFIEWLNDNYFHLENQKSVLIESNAKHNPEYPSAKF